MSRCGAVLAIAILWLVVPGCGDAGDDPAVSPPAAPDAPATASPPGERELELLRGLEKSEGSWVGVRRHGDDGERPGLRPNVADRLAALGYLDGQNQRPEKVAVTVWDERRAQDGLNLYVAGHDEEAILMDMAGRVVHRWRADYGALRERLGWTKLRNHPRFFRRAHLYEDGSLLALYDNRLLVKLDRDSNVVWVYGGLPHHDLFVEASGVIHVVTNELRELPWIKPRGRVLDNYLVTLDPHGEELGRVSILEALRASGQQDLLADVRAVATAHAIGARDLLHTNTVELVDERLARRLPGVRPGTVLISLPKIHAIAILDLEQRRVVWHLRGAFRWQHHPTVLENGNILLFDNQRGPDERSAVSEIDPVTGETVWAYRGTEEQPLYSWCCGTCERLANGNTLIVETQGGRAIEVTPTGEVVWEFVNPHRAGAEGDLIAQLFDVVRLPPDFPRDWLPASAATPSPPP